MNLWHEGGRVCDIKAGKTKELMELMLICGATVTGRGAIGRDGVSHRRA
jgi:hypothetical protein